MGTESNEKSKFLTVLEACAELRVSRVTLYRRIKAGELKTARFGGRILVPRSALERIEAEAR
jgi:excisionase family DNA binding protein